MRPPRPALVAFTAAVLGAFAACAPAPARCASEGDPRWDAVCGALEDAELGPSVVLLGDAEGRAFTWEQGADEGAPFRLASASKWLAATALLDVVERGELSLDHRPADVWAWAKDDPDEVRRSMTLAHLLSFTAGFDVHPLLADCTENPLSTPEACARRLYEGHHADPPGEVFYYGPAPLQIAAAMATTTTGLSWEALFRQRLQEPAGLSDQTAFLDPSPSHPRISAGARSTAADLERFLQALLHGDLIPDHLEAMATDWTPSDEVLLRDSPASGYFGYGWHFGLGAWRDCRRAVWTASCDERRVLTTVGAFGVAAWLDLDRGLYGVLMRDDGLVQVRDDVTLQTGGHSAQLMMAIRPTVERILTDAP